MDLIWLLVIVLVVLWLLGLVAVPGMTLIHALLVIALIVAIWRIATGRRVV